MTMMKESEVNFESGIRFLLMILIMGTNSASFFLLDSQAIFTYTELDYPKAVLDNSSVLDLPILLLYFTGYVLSLIHISEPTRPY